MVLLETSISIGRSRNSESRAYLNLSTYFYDYYYDYVDWQAFLQMFCKFYWNSIIWAWKRAACLVFYNKLAWHILPYWHFVLCDENKIKKDKSLIKQLYYINNVITKYIILSVVNKKIIVIDLNMVSHTNQIRLVYETTRTNIIESILCQLKVRWSS